MAEMNVLYAKGSIDPKSTVLINLSGPGGPTGRIGLRESMTLEALGINPDTPTVTAPTFPSAEIAYVNNNTALSDAQKADRVGKILAAFNEATKAYQSNGGETLPDQVIAKVEDWLVDTKGWARTDTAGKPVIKSGELVVTIVPLAQGGVLFAVNGSACWGITFGANI